MTTYGRYAKSVNLYIEKGTDWELTFNFIDSSGSAYDLTSYSNAAAKMRANYDSISATDFSVSINAVPSTGKITISLTSTLTEAVEWTYGVWDLEIDDPSGNTRRLIQGSVRISEEATK